MAAVVAVPATASVAGAAPAPRSSARGIVQDRAKAYGVVVKPRSTWATEAAPPAGLATERAVNVLLVHHSDSPNSYPADAVPATLRGFWRFHTGPDKGWPDIAYNFFVDRFGGVWEGRSGSLLAPVVGSATGGNQGHSQLICLIGNHSVAAPSGAAVLSLTRLLAALADRYDLLADPVATSAFVSRGSNRWPVGATVTSRSIEGHRSMSMTSCPGDAAFALLPEIRLGVQALRRP